MGRSRFWRLAVATLLAEQLGAASVAGAIGSEVGAGTLGPARGYWRSARASAGSAGAQGQTRRPPARRGATPPVQTSPAAVTCPAELGVGVTTGRRFCDILIGSVGRDLASAVRIVLPPHRGPATLAFDLHNRHTYSEQEVRAGRAYAEYTATVAIFAADGTPLARGVVRSEFRTVRDLLDRIAGGAGPDGLKAVAPLGSERILVEVPEGVTEVFVLGERLDVRRPAGRETFTAPGRPVASLSRVDVEYRPASLPRPRR
jgi:hypothetical protein